MAIGVVGNNGPKSSTLNWSVSGRQNIATAVGGSDALQVTVTNNGSAAFDLILYLNAKDDRLKHYVITDPGGCSLNTSLERLECGPLAASETRTINVSGTAKDAGNFKFELDVADQEGSQISYPSQGSFTWNAAVTP